MSQFLALLLGIKRYFEKGYLKVGQYNELSKVDEAIDELFEDDKMRINLQPIGYVNRGILLFLKERLGEVFGKSEVSKPVEINRICFDRVRRKYISTCLLKSYPVKETTLFITEHDLFADQLNFVFGEAELGGKRAIISLYRLKPEFYGMKDDELFKERALKEAMHELGHVFGLIHCRNFGCVMLFSNSILDTDRKGWKYCDECLEKLKEKGIGVRLH
jgi:archaemetzincin